MTHFWPLSGAKEAWGQEEESKGQHWGTRSTAQAWRSQVLLSSPGALRVTERADLKQVRRGKSYAWMLWRNNTVEFYSVSSSY